VVVPAQEHGSSIFAAIYGRPDGTYQRAADWRNQGHRAHLRRRLDRTLQNRCSSWGNLTQPTVDHQSSAGCADVSVIVGVKNPGQLPWNRRFDLTPAIGASVGLEYGNMLKAFESSGRRIRRCYNAQGIVQGSGQDQKVPASSTRFPWAGVERWTACGSPARGGPRYLSTSSPPPESSVRQWQSDEAMPRIARVCANTGVRG